MDANNPSVAPNAGTDSEYPRLDLIAQVHDHSRSVIEAELQRLSRRVATLGRADLDVVGAALEHLSESLILHRLRTAPPDTAPLVWRLFGPATEDA
jgi:hypothetical protein